MSVYTIVLQQDVALFLQNYNFGALLNCSGIEDGIENSNYRLETSKGHYILTLYESLAEDEVVSVIAMMRHLHDRGFPAPLAISGNNGEVLGKIKDKPAALFYCLPGASISSPTVQHCRSVGKQLAVLHQLGPELNYSRHNNRNLAGCRQLYRHIQTGFSSQQQQLIETELAYQSACQQAGLPKGVVHADLFRDNVLFYRGKLTAVLDFYTACQDVFILDLAIACNDWCVEQGEWQSERMQALLAGYQSVRPLTRQEKGLWPVYCRFAALRFWLSRRYHQLNPREGEITQNKDPDAFRRLLEYHIAKTQPLDSFNLVKNPKNHDRITR